MTWEGESIALFEFDMLHQTEIPLKTTEKFNYI